MTDETREQDKIRVNVEAAAARHRQLLPPTYKPSVRDVCEESYKTAANEWYAMGHSVGAEVQVIEK